MRKAALYLRVSTIDQTTANQERELRDVAARMGCEIVKVYKDHGISGAKGRDKRPAFDSLCRDGAGPRERDKERQRHWPATYRRQARGEDSRPSRLWQGYLQHCGRGWCWRCDGAADQGGEASLIACGEPTQSPRPWGSWGHITASRGPFRS